jgi:hypothetical protein
MLKLLLCFYSSRNFFGFGSVKRLEKTTGFGGLGEPPACSLTTESVQFHQISGKYEKQATAKKVLNGQKEGSCFRTSQMSKFAAMMRSSNRRKPALWEVMFVRGFQPKGSKHLRIIHCSDHFQIYAKR